MCPFVFVLQRPSIILVKPKIDRNTFKSVTIKAGRSHKWSVDVAGEPAPELTWSWRDGVPLTNSERIKIENVDYHTEFQLLNAVRKDTGKYTLTAKNKSGTDTETVELIVLAAPASPGGPLEVNDVTATSAKLKWKKPEDDGGSPIKEYEIEKMDLATGKWVRVGRSPGDQVPPEFNVTGLTPGAEYKFRVSAINDEGESTPLETIGSIIAKNPFDEPTKPGQPQIVDYDNQSVDLKWDPPKSDGGAPIEKFVIQKKSKGSNDWIDAAEVPGDKNEAHVDGLKEQDEVQFRVVAVNKAGKSPASEATGPHRVRHRACKLTELPSMGLFRFSLAFPHDCH